MAYNQKPEFDEPLLGCFSDMNSCLIVGCLPCGGIVLQSLTVEKATGEPCMNTCCSTLFFAVCCSNGFIGLAANRGEIRRAMNVKGSFFMDFCTMLWCGACAICQEHREVKRKNTKVY